MDPLTLLLGAGAVFSSIRAAQETKRYREETKSHPPALPPTYIVEPDTVEEYEIEVESPGRAKARLYYRVSGPKASGLALKSRAQALFVRWGISFNPPVIDDHYRQLEEILGYFDDISVIGFEIIYIYSLLPEPKPDKAKYAVDQLDEAERILAAHIDRKKAIKVEGKINDEDAKELLEQVADTQIKRVVNPQSFPNPFQW